MALHFPSLSRLPLDRYEALVGLERMARVARRVRELEARLSGRVVWNVSSSAVGGGVAEMVRTLLAYARGAGVDARWAVIEGSPAFFHVTKRLHHALHGSAGDGSPLGEVERACYERVSRANAAALVPLVREDDVVIVHDPQPAGMIPHLLERGVQVIWRCHIGCDEPGPEVARGYRFLLPYLDGVSRFVFSRAAYVPELVDACRVTLIPPSLDPFSAKNQPLGPATIGAILGRAGILTGPHDHARATFVREDGSPDRVDRAAEVIRHGPPPEAEVPLVVQVSRWDPLKDPRGVLEAFARLRETEVRGAHLLLAGPSVGSVADDPESGSVLAEVAQAARALPPAIRARVHLVSLPMEDVDENAAIVNALQRHAAVIVQKSLQEGFGLTVTEAMWKGRPVVASAVGGIIDQIADGQEGLLVPPADLDALGRALVRVLGDEVLARHLGARAQERVLDHFLGIDSLLRYGTLIEAMDEARAHGEPAPGPQAPGPSPAP